MNKTWSIGIALVGIIALSGLVYGQVMGRPRMMGYAGCCHGCPMMQHMGGYYGTYRTEQLTKNDAETMVQDYLYRLGNPNLKQGALKETEREFEAEIVTKDNSLVEKLLIDKQTGWMRPTY